MERMGSVVPRGGLGGKALRKMTDRDAAALVRAAWLGGMTLFSTSRVYGESERRIALGLSGVPRADYVLATGTRASTADALERDLAASLEALAVDYIDIYKLHNPASLPGELRAALDRALALGKIRMVGVSTGSLKLATDAVNSGYIGAVEYPLNSLASDEELELVGLAAEKNVVLLAQKPLAGGLLRSIDGAFAFLRDLTTPIPLWGPEYMWQLEQIIGFEKKPPRLTPELWSKIHDDRSTLSHFFCRGCGECMPCPAGIDIPLAVRIPSLVSGADWQVFAAPEVQEKMRRATKCVGCGRCTETCPHHLQIRELLRRGVDFYGDFLREHGSLD